jgi:pyruvate dehydrogenase kinase 2/3/4
VSVLNEIGRHELTGRAEYWAGSLEIHSLEGYGVDAFLQISKLGNKNERLTTRASMDAI